MKCKNCEHDLLKEFHFCPECGQEIEDKLTLKVLFHHTISNYFSVDALFFKSINMLLFHPGELTKVFISGKRNAYLHPAKFYLFTSILFFFLFSFVSRDNEIKFDLTIEDVKTEGVFFNQKTILELDSLFENNASFEQQLQSIGLELPKNKIKHKIYQQFTTFLIQRGKGFVDQLYNKLPISLFFIMPIFALFLKLFLFKKRPYAYHLVFCFYYLSFIFLIYSLYILLELSFNLPEWGALIPAFLTFMYLFLSIKNFNEERKYIYAFIKTSFISLLFTLTIAPIAFIILIVLTLFTYH